MKRIVISDIHIGSKYYKSDQLIQFLKSIEYDELILAGDIIDFIKVPTFTKRALEIANSINYNKRIIYLVGNHDTPLSGFIGTKAFGVEFMREYYFEENGRRFKIEHGDKYDTMGIAKYHVCMSIVSVLHNFLENYFSVDFSTWWTNYQIKKKKLRRIWDILQWNEDVDVLIMGHYHDPEAVIWVNKYGKIVSYINSGDWVSNSSYVSIIDGEVRLKIYEQDS